MSSPPLPLPKILAMAFTIFPMVKAQTQPTLLGSAKEILSLMFVEAALMTIHFLTQQCPNPKEAIGWYDNCMLHYSSRPIFGAMEVEPQFIMVESNDTVIQEDLFRQNLRTLLDSLKDNAFSGASLQKYAAGDIFGDGLGRIYALLQCTPDLSQLQCDACLDSAFKSIPPCCKIILNYFSPSCNVRYQMSPFFEPSADLPPPLPLIFVPSRNTMSSEAKKKNTIQTTIVIVLPFVALLVLAIGIYTFLRSRKLRKRLETSDDDIGPLNFLQYDFKTIRDATDDFSISNKLGKGGFGIVYKGKLFNGQEVAVKKASSRFATGRLRI